MSVLAHLFRPLRGRRPKQKPADRFARPSPVRPRVLLIIHDPLVPSQKRKLSQLFGWNNPDELAAQYITDLQDASYGYVRYQIVERIEVDEFPLKADGFAYTPEAYYINWRAKTGWHEPDLVDYGRLISQFGLIERVNDGRIDEVWLFAFPYAGYYESMMVGPGAFWCNAPPLQLATAKRRFVMMGFNYERGVGEMLENFGHRVESIMSHVYAGKHGRYNLWEHFTRYDKKHPGQAACGNVHFAPNSQRDYDWGNRRQVLSYCDNWLNFPNLSGSPRLVDCREWGNGDIRKHHLWWLLHLPCREGHRDGILHNWWEYVVNVNHGR